MNDVYYGVPEQKKFPLDTRAHVISAVRFFNYVDPQYEKELAARLSNKVKEYGIKLEPSEQNKFYKYYTLPEDTIAHFGIQGMKWGIRRYQNGDGSYTAAGKARYGVGDGKSYQNISAGAASATAARRQAIRSAKQYSALTGKDVMVGRKGENYDLVGGSRLHRKLSSIKYDEYIDPSMEGKQSAEQEQPAKKGLTTGQKVAIGVGVTAAAALTAYGVYKVVQSKKVSEVAADRHYTTLANNFFKKSNLSNKELKDAYTGVFKDASKPKVVERAAKKAAKEAPKAAPNLSGREKANAYTGVFKTATKTATKAAETTESAPKSKASIGQRINESLKSNIGAVKKDPDNITKAYKEAQKNTAKATVNAGIKLAKKSVSSDTLKKQSDLFSRLANESSTSAQNAPDSSDFINELLERNARNLGL